MKLNAAVSLALCFALIASPAMSACLLPADVEITAKDSGRLEHFELSRARGLGSALLAESTPDRMVLAELFSAGLAPAEPEQLPGSYQCRTIKAGGLLPLTVYGWFRCEIAREGDDLLIRKTSGSQQFSGMLYPGESGVAYRGAGHYGDEQPRAYGDDPEQNDVGCLSGVVGGAGHYVLELPEPQRESLHDVIELKRR